MLKQEPSSVCKFMPRAFQIMNENVNTLLYAIHLFKTYNEKVSEQFAPDIQAQGDLLQFAVTISIAVKLQEDVPKRVMMNDICHVLKDSSEQYCHMNLPAFCSIEFGICSFLEYKLFMTKQQQTHLRRHIINWYDEHGAGALRGVHH